MSSSLRPRGLQHARLPCPSLSSSLLKLMSVESVILPKHIILCRRLLLPSFFPSIRVFSNESALCIAKVLELQDQFFQWIFRVDFLWGWLVWSLCSPNMWGYQDYSVFFLMISPILFKKAGKHIFLKCHWNLLMSFKKYFFWFCSVF